MTDCNNRDRGNGSLSGPIPSLTETSEDVKPIVEYVSREAKRLHGWNFTRIEEVVSVVEDAIYAHAVPRDENGSKIPIGSVVKAWTFQAGAQSMRYMSCL